MSLMSRGQATRRGLLTAVAGGVVLGVAGSASARDRLDLDAPGQRLRAYMLMRGALDDRLVIGFVSGRYYGVVDADIQPLFGVLGATFSRYRPHPAGGYETVTYEIPFFTNLATGAELERWTNPYTGEPVTVPPMSFPPSRVVIGPDLTLRPAAAIPGVTSADRILEPLASGDDVWMTEENLNIAAVPGRTRSFHYNEWVTTHARRFDLEAPGVMRVACDTAYQSISSWRPWQKMGDHPGGLMARGSGRYGARLEDLPPAWLKIAKAKRPDVLANPGGPLEALWRAPA